MVRPGVRAATAALTALAVAGCVGAPHDGSDPTSGATTPTPGPTVETWDLVVLSDSSGWGLAEAWAELIRRDEGVEVDVTDLTVGGQSGTTLLESLSTEGDPQREAVRDAEVLSVWGSASSVMSDSDLVDCVYYPDQARPPTRVGRRDLAPYAELWRDILAEINRLRHGRSTALRTRDIYNPVLSHHLAAGTAEACAKGFLTVSAIIRDETRRAGGRFVLVYRAFNGPDGMTDPRDRQLFQDMEHLNDRGIALMARLHHRAGYEELTRE